MSIKQPDDKSHFILPDLGEGIAEAELIRWKVKAGDAVEEHQTLAEMETDKALVEVPSPWAGVIKEINGNPGDILAVGSVLVTYESGAAASSGAPEHAAVTAAAESDDAGTVVGSVDTKLAVSRALTRRREPETTTTGEGKALATPAVRRVARELGIDINAVPGTGRGGRVTASDVYAVDDTAAPPRPAARPAAAVPTPAPLMDGNGVAERIPFIGLRRKIAQALHHAVQTAVQDQPETGFRRDCLKHLGERGVTGVNAEPAPLHRHGDPLGVGVFRERGPAPERTGQEENCQPDERPPSGPIRTRSHCS